MNVFGVDKMLFVPFFFISFFFFFENIWTFILNNTQKSYRSNEYHLPLIRLFEFYKSPFNLVYFWILQLHLNYLFVILYLN